MSLIVMAVHDTEENGRSEFTKKTLFGSGSVVGGPGIIRTVNWSSHRMIIVDNGSCEETKKIITDFKKEIPYNYGNEDSVTIIPIHENIGTARAFNRGMGFRKVGEHVIKIDNDITISGCYDWVEQLEECVAREPKIGQIGLKRKDCWETTWHENPGNRSELIMLPHEPGQRWILVEKVKHVIGTCVLHSSALLDKIGYMYQPGLYGYDDTLMSCRANVAGFWTCFLSHIEIDHIDPGGTEYIKWKNREAGQYTQDVVNLMRQYVSGEKSVYHDFY